MKNEKFTTIPESLQESKAFKALGKLLGEVEIRDFYRRSINDLEATIVACETQQAQAKAEVEENENFKKADGIVKEFRKGLAEIFKPLKAKKAAAAEILNYRKDLSEIPDIEADEEVIDDATVTFTANIDGVEETVDATKFFKKMRESSDDE